ncbi:type IV secretory system conjugative DNA transfer family protein [Chryseobacterium limigenitum]|uniref:Type IV secretory system Conjugative DNA transfer n=1 Tax=Chryseobacterium limigenitum TaxID=1612149 RepID=A0A1K2IS24_9FLAO|nr:type IV secretory system conjugative DNA transfer family protein [Chryseobacterium limigenitum]SFZ95237.1 Type IV secretory system Conjugative DNA transfer [Chryseobacterium limigenitum]
MIKNFLLKQIKKQISESSPIGKQFVENVWEKDHSLKASFGKPSSLISPHEKGFCIDGKNFISIAKSRENYLVVAPSGKGKSQVSVFPFLLNAKGKFSIIVNDPSGELSQTISYLESVGYRCSVLDFGKKTGVYFNVLDGCKNNLTQMRKVAKTLVSATTHEKEDFFTISAEDCIVLFIQYLTESEPSEYLNLANVYRLILEYQASPNTIENLVATKGTEGVFRKFRALAGTSENTRKSIVASALAALSFVGEDPTLCDITSRTTIRFENFRHQPHALFVQVPVGDTKFYAPIVSMLFQSFYRYSFNNLPSNNELDIFCILDEFDTLTAISDYSAIISNARKFKIPQQIILQSEALLSKYGENSKNILNNCNVKCYYGGLGEESYQLERILGSYEYDKETGHSKQRPLMAASEVREMKDQILVIPSGDKPLKVSVTPAYKQPELVRKLNMRSQNPQPVENFTVSYIDLTPYR